MLRVNAADFGLVSGTTELQHTAIQRAIDHCFLEGGGEVWIPKGEYHMGDVRLRSNITLRLAGGVHLIGSLDPEDYFHYREDVVEPLDPSRITDAPYVHLSKILGETEYDENKPEYRFRRLPGSRWNNALIRILDAHDVAIIAEKGAVIDGSDPYDELGEVWYRGPHGIAYHHS